jgi:hypothetical protein
MKVKTEIKAGCKCEDNCSGCKPGPQEILCLNQMDRMHNTGSCDYK